MRTFLWALVVVDVGLAFMGDFNLASGFVLASGLVLATILIVIE